VTPESDTPDSPESPASDRGVFGNLPSERPGVRSPRRSGDKQVKAAKARPTPTPPPPPPPSRPSAPEAHRPAASRDVPPDPTSQGRGIEDVAWAGVTVAAEAATLGVRLFSRALEAVRERR
jgi:hypothetical protein